ncbi:MAG: helix-turn-helix domain-containing protein [Bacteroidales bacterium]|nr:helix-turn-helix domain-containing protein [Bacteroidales bacterium]
MQPYTSMDDQFLGKINKIIEDHLDNEHFSVEDLAKDVGISRSMLHRKLVRLTGKSAGDFITGKRLIRAREMLEKDVATTSEIAYKVGFSSPSYFTKVFKNYFSMLPGDVRKGSAIPTHAQPISQSTSPLPGRKNLKRRIIALVIATILIGIGIIVFQQFAGPEPAEKSIAILPFENLSTDAENRFFADGIVEDLLYRLSSISDLKVISRTSSEVFRDKGSKTVPDIAKLLGVNYILEGSVQQMADQLRINIQLIDARSDDHILSKQFDRKLQEVFTIQSEIADLIASELSLVLTEQQADKLKKNHITSLKALEYIQLGRYHLNQRDAKSIYTSIEYFRKAITEDPGQALAYAEMADAYFISSWYGYINRQTGRDSAEYLALKAVKIDRNIGEAHTVLGVIYNEYDWNYVLAEKEFQRAMFLNPNHATNYQYYAELLTSLGNLNMARELFNKAIQLDPFSYIVRFSSSYAYFREKKYEQAITEFKICEGLGKNNTGPLEKEFFIHIKTGNPGDALKSYKKLGMMTSEWTPETADSIFQAEGIRGLLLWKLKIGNWNYPMGEAQFYAMLGEKDKALHVMERALEKGLMDPFNTADPEFEDLRSEPRFIAIREKMGLPPLH